jgi:MFS family permease
LNKSRFATLAIISVSHGINHIYQLAIPVVIPKILDDYGLSMTSAGVLISIFSLSYALFQTPSGYLSKFVGRKKVIILGFIILSLSFLFLGLADNIMLFSLLIFVAGIGGSTYHPNGMPLLSQFYKENRGQASGFHQTGGSLGSFIAPLILGALVVLLGWRTSLTILSVPGLIISMIIWFLIIEDKNIKEESKIDTSNKSEKKGISMYKNSLIFICATIIFAIGIRGIDSFANLYFTKGRGITDFIQASFLFSSLKIAGLFSGPLCGKLSDMLGRRKMLITLVCVESLSIYALTVVPTGILLIPCLIFGFSSFGLLAITDAFLADITPEEYQTAVFGIHFTLSFFTQAIIPTILGAVVDYSNSFDMALILLSAIVPLSILFILKVRERKYRSIS